MIFHIMVVYIWSTISIDSPNNSLFKFLPVFGACSVHARQYVFNNEQTILQRLSSSFQNKHVLSLSELSTILKHSGRHMALSRLVTLSISSLRNLDIDANKFYDRAHRLYNAAILTLCYTQHALRPYIDSEINHIRHFIKIQFVNKGIEFINLPSIF